MLPNQTKTRISVVILKLDARYPLIHFFGKNLSGAYHVLVLDAGITMIRTKKSGEATVCTVHTFFRKETNNNCAKQGINKIILENDTCSEETLNRLIGDGSSEEKGPFTGRI